MIRLRSAALLLAVTASRLAAQAPPTTTTSASTAFAVPAWAFPWIIPAGPLPRPDSVELHHIPGSAVALTRKQIADPNNPPDWFPAGHPPAPNAVAHGNAAKGVRACAVCHLYTGAGRPENATVAGLPAAYIVAQTHAFRDSTRRSANPVTPWVSMHYVAANTSDAELAEAAAYYAAIPLTRRNHVIEADTIPKIRVAAILYARDEAGGTEPLAGRLIELPEELERHEMRDPTVTYTTYVPRGALARGKRLSLQGPAGPATACVTCHGPQLKGVGLVPPIAGRSPSNLLRQIINFRTGVRHTDADVPMHAVVNALSLDDMIAAAAYAGSLAP